MRLLEPRLAAETFEYLDLETQLAVLGSISELESATILNAMAPDDPVPRCWPSFLPSNPSGCWRFSIPISAESRTGC